VTDTNCAIAGIGETAYVRGAGASTVRLAAECSLRAIHDAGLEPADIDGIILYWLFEPLDAVDVAMSLGIPRLSWMLNVAGGGNNGAGVVTTATAAINAGLATNVLCLHAVNRFSARPDRSGGPNLLAPFGQIAAPQMFALWAQRHMHEYGTTAEQLGEIAVTFRRHAGMNERALMRKPITLDDYLASPMITTPFRLLDCCLETDGGAACVVTSKARAMDLRHRPVHILGGVCNAWGPAANEGGTADEYTSIGSRYAGPRLWEGTGLRPQDMDFAQLYDCFTYSVIAQLEDLGFCGKGEGGAFVEGGRIGMQGELPLNTSGGHLSEGYVRTMNLLNEAVRQLRRDYAGTPRQVRDAQLGLVTSAPNPGSAVILARD